MHPIFVTFGAQPVFTYGVFLLIASAAAVAWAAGSAHRLAAVPPLLVVEGATAVLGGGLVASKIGLLVQEGGSAFAGPGGLLRFVRSGGVIHAGVVGGLAERSVAREGDAASMATWRGRATRRTGRRVRGLRRGI